MLCTAKPAYAICPCRLKIFDPVCAVSTQFSDKLEKIILKDDDIISDEEAAVARIAAWMSDNRYPSFKEFIEILTPENVETILGSATRAELTSTEFIPILEKENQEPLV